MSDKMSSENSKTSKISPEKSNSDCIKTKPPESSEENSKEKSEVEFRTSEIPSFKSQTPEIPKPHDKSPFKSKTLGKEKGAFTQIFCSKCTRSPNKSPKIQIRAPENNSDRPPCDAHPSPRSLPGNSPNSGSPRVRRSSTPAVLPSNTVQPTTEQTNSQRVFKKSAPNNKITLYLSSRDLVISDTRVDKLHGVLLVDPEYVQDRKVYGQVTLTFRYGREDEEVMGLRFCNEAVMSLHRLYPVSPEPDRTFQEITPLQEALVRRLGANATAFTLEVTPIAPPSVQLVPAKEYSGAPIGTSYDIRAYIADRADEKPHRRSMVRMGIRVLQRCPLQARLQGSGSPPRASVEKPFLLSEGKVRLEAVLDRKNYKQGEPVHVRMTVHNHSGKTVRRIKIFVVQHVDVCMFSNGKFKNVVAIINSRQDCPVSPGISIRHSYTLYPTKGATKNWIALEDSYSKAGSTLASTVARSERLEQDRNVFAIYVTYYVKVKLIVGAMSSQVSVKLPFNLLPSEEPELDELYLPRTEKIDLSEPPVVRVESSAEQEEADKIEAENSNIERPIKIGATAVCEDQIETEKSIDGNPIKIETEKSTLSRPIKIGATAVCEDTIEKSESNC